MAAEGTTEAWAASEATIRPATCTQSFQVEVVGTARRDAAPQAPAAPLAGPGPNSAGEIVMDMGSAKARASGWHRRRSSAPGPTPLDNPWRKETAWNPSGCLVYGVFVAAYLFYFYCRIAFTLGGGVLGYAGAVLGFELLASSSMLVHGLGLLRKRCRARCAAAGPPPAAAYNIRVLIPCYTEAADIVAQTVLAAANADLPSKCRRTVYVLDDGRDPAKQSFVAAQGRDDLVYVSGRVRAKGESNGKACNLNNTLTKLYPPGRAVDERELVVVFDADMVCAPGFYSRVLGELADPQVALVLTPQKFHNYDADTDIFNHSNLIYWQISLPGLDGWDNVSCTGTNFVVRANAAAEAGWFPEYTLGEDMALALEIQRAGWKGAYVKEYLAVGEVPETVRNTFMQKSRWCKGGMQIFFSSRNALFGRNMSLMQKIVWNTSGWAYICTTLTTPVFLVVPWVGVWAGYFPLEFTRMFALAFTIYFPASYLLLYYCHDLSHMRSIYFSVTAGNMFWFAFAKATFNTLGAALFKREIRFKTTEKSHMAANVTDSANKAKARKGRSPLRTAWTYVQDVWIHAATLLLCGATVALGGTRLASELDLSTVQTLSILVSMGWSLHNMAAPYLLLHFCFFRTRGLKAAIIATAFCSTLIVAAILVLVWIVLPNPYDYGAALGGSLRFYAAQRSGVLPADNPVPWRGDSGLDDVAPNGASLVGGYYDDGGTVKYGFPLASTIAVLAWGLLEYPAGYTHAGVTDDARVALKWGTDYMLACQLTNASLADLTYVAQVGAFELDREFWGKPEQMAMARPAYVVDTQAKPGTDLLAGTAAALAASSLALRPAQPGYADELLLHARQLYAAANVTQGRYSDSIGDALFQYPSSGWLDDLAWGAAWLYAATGEAGYLNEAAAAYALWQVTPDQQAAQPAVWNWDNQAPGAAVLLAKLTGYRVAAYTRAADDFLGDWIGATGGVLRTPAYLSWLGPTSALRNTANAAFLAWTYQQNSGGAVRGKHRCWAEYQARYMLGDNGQGFVVGQGRRWPQQPQHGAASCPGPISAPCGIADFYAAGPNPHELTGALVAGPAFPNDGFTDVRALINSRVALDYNAAWTGLLAALTIQGKQTFTHCTQGHGFFYNLLKHSPI